MKRMPKSARCRARRLQERKPVFTDKNVEEKGTLRMNYVKPEVATSGRALTAIGSDTSKVVPIVFENSPDVIRGTSSAYEADE